MPDLRVTERSPALFQRLAESRKGANVSENSPQDAAVSPKRLHLSTKSHGMSSKELCPSFHPPIPFTFPILHDSIKISDEDELLDSSPFIQRQVKHIIARS